MIDSTGDISAINDLLDEINNTIEENSNSLTDIISRISTLEIDDDKYNSDVVGCWAESSIDHTMKIYKNGVGVIDWFDSISFPFQIFTWEILENNIQFNFGERYYVSNGIGGYLYEGTQIAVLEIDSFGYEIISGLTYQLNINGLVENYTTEYNRCF